MPTATETTKTEVTALTGSAAIAASIAQTNRSLEAIRSQQSELLNDERRAEAELSQQQSQLAEARAAEQAEAKERALSEQLRALKAKAVKLNQAAEAFAELYEGFRSDYSGYLNSLGPTESQAYYNGGQRFSASSLPYVTGTEAGAEVVRITSLASAPKDGSKA